MAEKEPTAAAVPGNTIAPAAVAPEAPAPAASPAASPAQPATPVAAEVKAEPERTPTLLEKFDEKKAAEAKPAEAAKPAEGTTKLAEPAKPGEAKPAEAKPAEAVKPAEGAKPAEAAKPSEPAKPEPVEYKYTLPETIKMDDALKGKVHTAFDAFRADPAQGAQKLIDLYVEQRTEDAKLTLKNQFDVFNKTKGTWEKDWMADPEIGGAGHMTAMGAIARTRDLGISSAKPGSAQYLADRAQFDQFLATTGAGSHPAFGRLLHNLARFIDEPQAAEAPTEIRPTKTNGKAPKGGIYTHPSSANMDK